MNTNSEVFTCFKCKFSSIGCPYQGNQLDVEKHESGDSHAELMMKLLLTLQTDQSRNASMLAHSMNKVTSLKYAVSSIQEECCSQIKAIQDSLEQTRDTEIKSYKQQMTDLKLKFNVISKRQTEHCDDVENYQKALNTVITANNDLTKAVAEDLKILTTKIDQIEVDLKNQLASKVSSFEYIWKVDKFGNHLDDAMLGKKIDIKSNPFYTSRAGYQMRLNICANRKRQGTHLSLYLMVMKGPNDAILSWPVQYTAQVSLMDQLTHKTHHSVTLESDIIEYKHCFDRPTHKENEGYGEPKFIRLDSIEPRYLVEDAMFFKFDLSITC